MSEAVARPTILIVDDDPTARQVAQAILSPENYSFRQATGGEVALKMIEEQEPDLVLLDVMMPGIDGFEVCRRIRKLSPRAYLPVMLLTALDSATDLAKGLGAGADDFISKPVPRVELRARVRSMLRIRRQNLELVEQRARLEAYYQQREDVVRMLVHDLRSPVTAIQLLASTLLSQRIAFSDVQKKDVETIREEARRVGRYLEEMLIMARQEEGKLSLSLQKVILQKIAKEAIKSISPVAKARGVRIVDQFDDEPIELMADAALMRRVVDNLLTNAIKFSPAETSIEVVVTRKGEHRILEVLDEGSGVPEEARSRIFEKYEIVKMREAGGLQTGLGLPFCRMVVEAHGGMISCLARKTRGSRFRVELPENAEAAEESA